MTTLARMKERLAALAPEQLEIFDDSAKHVGHEGAKSGGGHYQLVIVSRRFEGLGKLARHRLIYETLAPLMQSEIHALSIQAFSPGEN
jgi:BolA protein